MSLWIYQGRRFALSLELSLIQGTVLFNFLHHNNFRRNIRTLLFGNSKENRLKIVIIYYQKQHRYSLRTVGDSLKEQRLPCYLSVFIFFSVSWMFIYTYPSCSLSDLSLHDTGENFISVVELVLNPIVYVWQ
jgi:hypothetical protein